MTKVQLILLSATALAGAAAYFINRRKQALQHIPAAMEPVKKNRHRSPVFSQLKTQA
jgi:hypothetical protein